MSAYNPSGQQYGGTIASDLGKLAIPLGLILSHAGLEKLIARGNSKKSSRAKNGGSDEAEKIRRRASIGGALRTKTPASPLAHVRVRVKGKPASPVKDKNADIRRHFQTIAIRVQEIFAKARQGTASPAKARSTTKASSASKASKTKAAKAKKAKKAKAA